MLTTIVPDQVWAAEHDLFMPGGMHFRGRMTVLRTDDGLWIHSPIPIDDALRDAIEALGPVRHLVAPNKLHHLHFASAQQAFPEARSWAAPGLADKRADLVFDGLISEGTAAWGPAVEACFIEGIPWMNEPVFYHPATGSLLVTDLFFNIQEVANLRSRFFFGLYGMFGKPKQSMMVWLSTKDTLAAARSAHRLLAWPFTRAIPAHGPVIEDDAHAVVSHVLAGMASYAPAD